LVLYEVPAGKYSSQISKKDANNYALLEINTYGQQFANRVGYCISEGEVYKWIPDPLTAYCEQTVVEEDFWTLFASPVNPIVDGQDLVYLDRSLNKIIRFDPRNLTQEA